MSEISTHGVATSEIDALLRLVEEDFIAPSVADEPDAATVGWKGDGSPMPLTFGHIRRARAAFTALATTLSHLERREAELLEANNRYLERARAAEAAIETARARGDVVPIGVAYELMTKALDRQASRDTAPAATRAALDVLAARHRQIVRGYDAAHDDRHTEGEIISADWGALARLTASSAWLKSGLVGGTRGDGPIRRYRELLVDAGSMTIAEIERVDRGILPQPVEPATVAQGEADHG